MKNSSSSIESGLKLIGKFEKSIIFDAMVSIPNIIANIPKNEKMQTSLFYK